MRIGIDFTVGLKQAGGIGRLTRGLIAGLAQLDCANEYTLLYAADARPGDIPGQNFHWQRLPFSERALNIAWHRAHLPLYIERFCGALDVFHAPNFTLPPSHAPARLVTVHDLTFLRYPEGAQPSLRRFLLNVVPRAARQASHVIADSKSTRDDLLDWLKLPADKISVVYAGLDETFQPASADAQQRVSMKYHLQRPFILGVGTLEPRKNYLGLMRACQRLGMADVQLIIAGKRGWLDEPIIETAHATPNVRLLGFVPDEDLPALYTLASVYCLPSYYEGFGIPCIEAMACGTAVVCSDRPCLPEIVGNAALKVPPDDADALANALRRVLEDRTLRGQLIERGFERARDFPWSRASRALLDVYEGRVYEEK